MPEVNFFWDNLSDNILQERDESGAVTAEYTTEPGLYGSLVSQSRGGVETQYHFDPPGSTVALSDDNQQITTTYAYSAFGEVISQDGSTLNPFQYIGQKAYLRDAVTGELSARHRWITSPFGRWLSVDPLTLDRYSYCRNSPITITDPSGLWTIELHAGLTGCAGCTGASVYWNYKVVDGVPSDKFLLVQHLVRGHVYTYCNVDRPGCPGGKPPTGTKCKVTRKGSCYLDVYEHLGVVSGDGTEATDEWSTPVYGNCTDGCEMSGTEGIWAVVRAFRYDETRDPESKKPTSDKWIPGSKIPCQQDFLTNRIGPHLRAEPLWWKEFKWEAKVYLLRKFDCCRPIGEASTSSMSWVGDVMGSNVEYGVNDDCCKHATLPELW